MSDWDELRAKLLPCVKCGEAKKLAFGCAQLCATAWVYCMVCGRGTPVDHVVELIEYAPADVDARRGAVGRWNTVGRQGKQR